MLSLRAKENKLYSVIIDGKGHDGNKEVEMPKKYAKHFRSLGYPIPDSNILESDLSSEKFDLVIAEPSSNETQELLED